jgi:hypothetical protein
MVKKYLVLIFISAVIIIAALTSGCVGNGRNVLEYPKKYLEQVEVWEITIPANYVRDTRLDWFSTTYRDSFHFYSTRINEKNFPGAIIGFESGQKILVRVFRLKKPVSTNGCLVFLRNHGAILTGAQGATLVWEQKREQVPKGFCYLSFDAALSDYKERPVLERCSDGIFKFRAVSSEFFWSAGDRLLCFSYAE